MVEATCNEADKVDSEVRGARVDSGNERRTISDKANGRDDWSVLWQVERVAIGGGGVLLRRQAMW